MSMRSYAFFFAALMGLGTFLCAGCSSSTATPASAKAVGSLIDTRDQLAQGRKQVDETQSALDALQSPDADLPAAFAAFQKEVKESEAGAAKVRERAKDMSDRAAEYQKVWQQDTAELNNPDLRASAQTRATRVRARFDSVTAKAADARAAYEPWITGLKDIEKYLHNDMTAAGVRNAKPAFRKAKGDGEALAQKMDAFSTELADVAASLSPPVPSQAENDK